MEMTREEVVAANGGNRLFETIAHELREDFMREGMEFYGQGVEARYRKSLNLYTGKQDIVLDVDNGDGMGSITVYPVTRADGTFGLEICVRNGDGCRILEILEGRMSDFLALETARLACAARFGLRSAPRSYMGSEAAE